MRILWNRWDDEAVEDVLAEDFAFRGSMGTRTQGRDGWRGYRDAIRRGAPDFRNEITELVADGQRAAARLSYTGHHAGPLAGLTATGRQFEYAGAAFFTARDGRAGLGLGARRPGWSAPATPPRPRPALSQHPPEGRGPHPPPPAPASPAGAGRTGRVPMITVAFRSAELTTRAARPWRANASAARDAWRSLVSISR